MVGGRELDSSAIDYEQKRMHLGELIGEIYRTVSGFCLGFLQQRRFDVAACVLSQSS